MSLCPACTRQRCLNVGSASAQGIDGEFERAIKFAERDACTNPRACASIYFAPETSCRALRPVALAYYRRAVTEDPSRAGWMRVAATAAIIGAHAEAASAGPCGCGTTRNTAEAGDRAFAGDV